MKTQREYPTENDKSIDIGLIVSNSEKLLNLYREDLNLRHNRKAQDLSKIEESLKSINNSLWEIEKNLKDISGSIGFGCFIIGACIVIAAVI